MSTLLFVLLQAGDQVGLRFDLSFKLSFLFYYSVHVGQLPFHGVPQLLALALVHLHVLIQELKLSVQPVCFLVQRLV